MLTAAVGGLLRFRHGANVTKAEAGVNGRERVVESAEMNTFTVREHVRK